MLNEKKLKEALKAFVKIIKTQIEMNVSLTIELSAVRETVRGLDPTFDDTLAEKRRTASQNTLPSIAGLVAAVDLLTAKLNEIC